MIKEGRCYFGGLKQLFINGIAGFCAAKVLAPVLLKIQHQDLGTKTEMVLLGEGSEKLF